MMKIFGRNKQIECSEDVFYEFLGYLANHPDDINIAYERNSKQGAWGDEFRIQFNTDFVRKYFLNLGIKVTAGVKGSFDSRLNCNDFINELYKLGFKEGRHQVYNDILLNIPQKYINIFNKGANL